MEITDELKQRFHEKYEKAENGCWIWTASVAGKGYGQIKIPKERKQIYAHRLSYMIYKGEVPKGLELCHTCDTPRCVNPDHLFPGTSWDNHQDMKIKGRSTYGESNARAKITEKQVAQVHAMTGAGIPQSVIAKTFGISQMQVSRIVRGEQWNYMKPK